MAQTKVDFTHQMSAEGDSALARWLDVAPDSTLTESPRVVGNAALELQMEADQLVLMAAFIKQGEVPQAHVLPAQIGGHQAQADKLGIGDFYAAASFAIRRLVDESRLKLRPAGDEEQLGFLPAVPPAAALTVKVVGIAAVAAVTFLVGRETVRSIAKLNSDAAKANARAHAAIEIAKAKILAGQTVDTPAIIQRMAAVERTRKNPVVWLGVVGLMGIVGWGAYKLSRPARRAASSTAPNPAKMIASRVRNARPRKVAKKATKKNAPKKNAPKKNAPKKNTHKKMTRAESLKKARAARAKKRAPAKPKKNPAPKTKAAFIKAQRAKGRSQAQAESAWKRSRANRKKKKNPVSTRAAKRPLRQAEKEIDRLKKRGCKIEGVEALVVSRCPNPRPRALTKKQSEARIKALRKAGCKVQKVRTPYGVAVVSECPKGVRRPPWPNPKKKKKTAKKKKAVKPHKRVTKKCKKCGRYHDASEHWSHKRAPKGGRKGGYIKKRQQNPLRRGFSPEVVSDNIAELRRAGKPRAQAVAIALEAARKAYRSRHPRGRFPSHLQRKKS